jgi:hypothetical protein
LIVTAVCLVTRFVEALIPPWACEKVDKPTIYRGKSYRCTLSRTCTFFNRSSVFDSWSSQLTKNRRHLGIWKALLTVAWFHPSYCKRMPQMWINLMVENWMKERHPSVCYNTIPVYWPSSATFPCRYW